MLDAHSSIVTVDFHGSQLLGFQDARGTFVALKPVVEGMSLDWSSQLQRLRRDPILSEGVVVMTMPQGRGGAQEMVCLTLELTHGFLFRIEAGRVRADLRERVILFQRECYAVLSAAFESGLKAPGRRSNRPELTAEEIALKRVRETRLAFGVRAARQVWISSGVLPIVPAMHAPDQPDLPFAKPGDRH